MKRVPVTETKGIIGTRFVCCLRERGYSVRGVDFKLSRWPVAQADRFWLLDLWEPSNA